MVIEPLENTDLVICILLFDNNAQETSLQLSDTLDFDFSSRCSFVLGET